MTINSKCETCGHVETDKRPKCSWCKHEVELAEHKERMDNRGRQPENQIHTVFSIGRAERSTDLVFAGNDSGKLFIEKLSICEACLEKEELFYLYEGVVRYSAEGEKLPQLKIC